MTGPQSAVIHTDDIDTIGIGSSTETHHLDLVRVDNFWRSQSLPRRVPRNAARTKTGFVGAPYPARAGPRRAQAEHSGVAIRSVVLARMKVARLGSVPTPGVARAAVPDLGARPFGTRPFLPGATQPAVVPYPFAATQMSKISEIVT